MNRYAVTLVYKSTVSSTSISISSQIAEVSAVSVEEAVGKVLLKTWKPTNEGSRDLHLWNVLLLSDPSEQKDVHIRSLEEENEQMFRLLSDVADSKENKLWKAQNIVKEFLKTGNTEKDESEQTGTA